MLEPGYGYLRISQFSETTGADTNAAIRALEQRSGGRLRGLVLDLRNNPGGVLDAAVEVSDAFLDKGMIVSAEGRSEESRFRMEAMEGDLSLGTPIAVLVNEGSASAAEIVAGALRDNGRAKLLGQQHLRQGLGADRDAARGRPGPRSPACPSSSGMTVCTEPLPNVRWPRSFARPLSRSAPATISAAEAEPSFTSTAIGVPRERSPAIASMRKRDSSERPSAETIMPSSRKASETSTAASSTPPGLLRRSSTRPRSRPPACCRARASRRWCRARSFR